MKIFISILLLLSSIAYAASWDLEKGQARDGAPLLRVINYGNVPIYCWVVYNNGYGYYDFYVDASGVSRWYYQPNGYYEVNCK